MSSFVFFYFYSVSVWWKDWSRVKLLPCLYEFFPSFNSTLNHIKCMQCADVVVDHQIPRRVFKCMLYLTVPSFNLPFWNKSSVWNILFCWLTLLFVVGFIKMSFCLWVLHRLMQSQRNKCTCCLFSQWHICCCKLLGGKALITHKCINLRSLALQANISVQRFARGPLVHSYTDIRNQCWHCSRVIVLSS